MLALASLFAAMARPDEAVAQQGASDADAPFKNVTPTKPPASRDAPASPAAPGSQSATTSEPPRKFSLALTTLVGTGNNGGERYGIWRDTYFQRESERGIAWGLGVEARYAFTPHRLFSAELLTHVDKIQARDEASYASGTIRASYDLISWRFGGLCLWPRIWRFRIGTGFGVAVISRATTLEVGGVDRSDENNSPFDIFLAGTVRFAATEEWGVDFGAIFTVSDSAFLKGGVSYAF